MDYWCFSPFSPQLVLLPEFPGTKRLSHCALVKFVGSLYRLQSTQPSTDPILQLYKTKETAFTVIFSDILLPR